MKTPLQPVRFAVVGYGTGGRRFHSPLLASAPECELVGVVTRSPERRALVAADHPGARCFDDLAQAVDAGIEAVAISTPASTHSGLTDEAIGLGLHVVCDKPFALDAAAAARSVALASQADRRLSPYQNRRWDSDFLTVRRLLDDGRLGDVFRFESKFERFKPAGPGPAGGGALLDLGSHLVDQALVLFGPVHRVYAEWRERESGLDDDLFVALTHDSGVRSQLWASWSQGAPGLRFRVSGTEGGLRRRRAHGWTGSCVGARRFTRDARRPLGRRARVPVGVDPSRARQRGDRAHGGGRVGHLLSPLRRRGPR